MKELLIFILLCAVFGWWAIPIVIFSLIGLLVLIALAKALE